MDGHLPRKALRRGANCAVSGGYTALNRITDVMRVASPRITQRLCAIGPPRGQAVRKETRDAAHGRDGEGPPAGGPVTRQAQAPAAARSSSRATARPRRSVPGFPRRRSCRGPAPFAGRSLRRSAAPAAVGAPWPRLRPSPVWLAPLVGRVGWGFQHLRPQAGHVAGPPRPVATQGGPPRGPPPPPIPPSAGMVWPPPPSASWPRSPRSRGECWI